MRSRILATIIVGGGLVIAIPGFGHGWTLDTPVILDTTHSAICILYNLDPSATCNIAPTTGYYVGVVPGAFLPQPIFAAQGFVPATLGPGQVGSTDLASAPPFPKGGMCHFDVTGCPKGKVRAVLSLDGGAHVPAY